MGLCICNVKSCNGNLSYGIPCRIQIAAETIYFLNWDWKVHKFEKLSTFTSLIPKKLMQSSMVEKTKSLFWKSIATK